MGGWLAGLDAFVVGAAYLVALLATRFVVRPLLVSVLASAPVVGGWLASNVDGGISAFERTITPAANASMGTIISALDWLVAQVRATLGGVTDLADALYAALLTFSTVTLPHAVDLGVQGLESLVADARGYALSLFQGAELSISTSLGKAEADAATLVSVARGDLEAEISAAEGVVLQEVRKVEQTTADLILQAEHDAGQLVAATESKLAELVAQARQDLGAAVGAVEHDLHLLAEAERVALADSVSILGGDLAAAEARANEAIGALDTQLQKSIDGILAGIPWRSLAATVNTGEAVLQADVRTLVGLTAVEIRKQLADAAVLRAKYGPQVAAALQELKV